MSDIIRILYCKVERVLFHLFTTKFTTMSYVSTNYTEVRNIEAFLNKHGILYVGKNLDSLSRFRTNNWTTLDEPLSIDPSNTGPASPIFKKIDVEIKWSTEIVDDETKTRVTSLRLEYKYEHPSGSNGYSVSLYSPDAGDFVDFETLREYLDTKNK